MLREIKVRRDKKDQNPVTVSYDFGDSLDEAHRLFDGPTDLDNVVFGLFLLSAKQQLQEHVRALLEPKKTKAKGKPGKPGYQPAKVIREALTPEQIADNLKTWKPTVERQAKKAVDKAARIVEGLSATERASLLERLGVGASDSSASDRAAPRGQNS